MVYHSPESVTPKCCMQNNTMLTFMRGNKKLVLKEGAKFKLEEILNIIQEALSLIWPSKAEDRFDTR